jgi:hypothetical protein
MPSPASDWLENKRKRSAMTAFPQIFKTTFQPIGTDVKIRMMESMRAMKNATADWRPTNNYRSTICTGW